MTQAGHALELPQVDGHPLVQLTRLPLLVSGSWANSRLGQDHAAFSLDGVAVPLGNVLAKRFDPELFAGLFDRFRTLVALPERYGMHVTLDEKGELVVGPLENSMKVDEYWKEIGLPPLRAYLKRYQSENGGKVVRVLEK